MKKWRQAVTALCMAAALTVSAAAVQPDGGGTDGLTGVGTADIVLPEGGASAEASGGEGAPEAPEDIPAQPEYPTGVSGEAVWTLIDGTMYITGQGIFSGVPNADCHPWEYFEDQIRHVVIEEGITVVGDLVFAHTYNLETVTIADTVTEICEGAFRNCYGLKSVKLPQNLQIMGNFVFAYCESLEAVVLPNSLTKMGGSVFTGCTSLASVTLPNDLYDIQQMNFDSCMALTEVTIPAGVGFLRHASFPNCFNLKKVYFDGDQPHTNGDPFYMGPADLVIYCYSDAEGWDEELFYTYPVVVLDRSTGLPVGDKDPFEESTPHNSGEDTPPGDGQTPTGGENMTDTHGGEDAAGEQWPDDSENVQMPDAEQPASGGEKQPEKGEDDTSAGNTERPGKENELIGGEQAPEETGGSSAAAGGEIGEEKPRAESSSVGNDMGAPAGGGSAGVSTPEETLPGTAADGENAVPIWGAALAVASLAAIGVIVGRKKN